MKKVLLLGVLCILAVTATAAFAEEASSGSVARASFTTGIENREPTEIITEYFPTAEGSIFFFTELTNMENSQVFHVWHKNGAEVYRFAINVGGARWRFNSSMKAAHFKAGDVVVVEITDQDGNVLQSVSLDIR